jgi:myo-inositol-1-phosphate synthase
MAPHADETTYSLGGSTQESRHKPSVPFAVKSPNVKYTNEEILSRYTYHTTSLEQTPDGGYEATPKETIYNFKVQRSVPKTGVLLVGWGGNNGSTVTAGILANRHGLKWETREGVREANYYGSVIMGSTIKLGTDARTGKEINIPFHNVLPMLHPNDLVIGGWDISSMNIADAMDRAQVLEPTLKALLRKEMSLMQPMPSIYYPDFIAANQEDRADNLIPGSKASMDHVEHIRKDIR